MLLQQTKLKQPSLPKEENPDHCFSIQYGYFERHNFIETPVVTTFTLLTTNIQDIVNTGAEVAWFAVVEFWN